MEERGTTISLSTVMKFSSGFKPSRTRGVVVKRCEREELERLVGVMAEIDESWGAIPCPYCGSVERIDHAPECVDHKEGCALKARVRHLQSKI